MVCQAPTPDRGAGAREEPAPPWSTGPKGVPKISRTTTMDLSRSRNCAGGGEIRTEGTRGGEGIGARGGEGEAADPDENDPERETLEAMALREGGRRLRCGARRLWWPPAPE